MSTKLEIRAFLTLTVGVILWAWHIASAERVISWDEVGAPFLIWLTGVYLIFGVAPSLYWKYRRWKGKRLYQTKPLVN